MPASLHKMSLLPTTRINSLVTSSSNVGADVPGIIMPGNDEDILLVDFQPVVVPSGQIMSSPSAPTATMYPIPPPGTLPGAHMVDINHHPSLSSDGITTPLSATGSSGKTNNPNNFSLVSLSNHHPHHHHNSTSRDESDLNYHHHSSQQQQQPLRQQLTSNSTSAVPQIVSRPYDEDDEFAKHQALAQPSYVLNKRRSRRIVSRDNHVWDNANHVGYNLQHSQHMSSSLSSSEDSDTGFLMGTRKTAYTRKSVQKVVDPHPTSTVGGGGNGSPSASTGLLPNIGNRKRVRRKRPSARNRKPVNSQRDKIPNPSDVLSFCCCLCDDDQPSHSSRSMNNASSLRNRYFRLTCAIIVIIVIAVLASITVSLQRKVDSLDLHLKNLDQAVGSPLSTYSGNGATNPIRKHSESLESLLVAYNELNSTVTSLKVQLEQVLGKLQELQKQVNTAIAKPDGVEEVKGELAKLGSRVAELSDTIGKVSGSVEQLKVASVTPNNGNTNGNGTANELRPTTRPPAV